MLERIDFYPTHTFGEFKMRAGKPLPLGATVVPGGVNFSVYSGHATQVVLVLYRGSEEQAMVEIPFPPEFRIGTTYSMIVFGLNYENIEYGYRLDGPRDQAAGHLFNPAEVLLDPYAKLVSARPNWHADADKPYRPRGRILIEDFDWETDRPLEIPVEEIIIYEMHVRGFTAHPSSGVKHRGTYTAIREKIPYLKELGVNCLELMPIFEFDEWENPRTNPRTGERLVNYWGYSTVGFFAPKAGFAATGRHHMQADELKNLVKDLHAAGIEVVLDVVFNHTAEGNEHGPTYSFRGFDNKTYYMLTPDGHYLDFSGCGNTLNCNNPIVRTLVLACLRYWVADYHIDGFRFDLASILGRDMTGQPLVNPPLIEMLAYDPVLARCKLIAEAWDAAGLYQVGSFPAYGRWAEWNGKYRDATRRFLGGQPNATVEVARRIEGSPDLYAPLNRGTSASINFITCHDGFTLYDLFAYNFKHNEENGEENRDGSNRNDSVNFGVEGPSNDPRIEALRHRMIKNAVALLMVSRGVPMILMGDEAARTQQGNNNTYCHDTEWNWFDWALVGKNAGLVTFFRRCIAFRKAHPVLREKSHFRQNDWMNSGFADISWHGVRIGEPDWSSESQSLAFMVCGRHARGGQQPDDDIYVAMNMSREDLIFALPQIAPKRQWHVFADTAAEEGADAVTPGEEKAWAETKEIPVKARAMVILVSRRIEGAV